MYAQPTDLNLTQQSLLESRHSVLLSSQHHKQLRRKYRQPLIEDIPPKFLRLSFCSPRGQVLKKPKFESREYTVFRNRHLDPLKCVSKG